MKVLCDLRALQSGNASGVETYTENILHALISASPDMTFILWTNSRKPLPEHFPKFDYPNAFHVHTRICSSFLNLSSYFLRRPHIDRIVASKAVRLGLFKKGEHFDVFFVPDPRPSPSSPLCRKVSLFHDLSPIHFQETFSQKTRFWHHLLRMKKEAEEASRICTPSRFTKEDIHHEFRIPEEKITVIGAGAAEHLRPIEDPVELDAVRKKYGIPPNFILTLSTLEPRKNLENLIEAFFRFQKRSGEKNLKLVIAGKKTPNIFSDIHFPESQALIFPGFIEEADKAALYSAAKMFVYPSYFEGFGLPVLEAMKCGTPVLSSSSSSLPEVYGDAAKEFDPYSVTEISQAIETVYMNVGAQEELRRKGLERSSSPNYSWSVVGEKLMTVFHEVLKNENGHRHGDMPQ